MLIIKIFRFLPDGSYLNALELGVKGLAKEMVNIINNTRRYSDFFKWRNYYTVHDAAANDYRESVCAFCAHLNDNRKKNKTQVYENITAWWNSTFPEIFPINETTTLKTEEIVDISVEITTSNVFSNLLDLFFD